MENKDSINHENSNKANRLLAPVYQSTHTTCRCGKNAELKFNGNWYGNKCMCGVNIRMHRDKNRIIIDDAPATNA